MGRWRCSRWSAASSDPGRDDCAREVPRADLRRLQATRRRSRATSAEWIGLGGRRRDRVAGIGLAFVLYVRRAGATLRAARPLPPCTTSSSTSGTSTSSTTRVVRAARCAAFGGFGRTWSRRDFVQGMLVGGADRRRARRHRVRARRSRPATCAPTRSCCCWASAGLALYFLIVSSMTVHLSILIFLPAGRRPRSALFLPRALARWCWCCGTVRVLGLRDRAARRLPTPARRPPVRDRRQRGSRSSASATRSASTGSTCS